MYQRDPDRPLRKCEVQSYLTFHSLVLNNQRITEKLFTEQDKECSAFIPSIQGKTAKAKIK